MSMADTHKETYREEAFELLSELEASLLEMEERPDDQEIIGRVFRAMHTIKGSGAMFGFDDIAKFTHEVETVYDLVRNGKITVTKQLIDITLVARDLIRAMLDSCSDNDPSLEMKKQETISQLRKLVPDASTGGITVTMDSTSPSPVNKPASEVNERCKTYRIRFRPQKEIMLTGINPLHLVNELTALGHCKIVAQTSDLPMLEDINPEYCYIYWDIILTTAKGIDGIKDIFVFVEDSELKIDVIDDHYMLDSDDDYKRLGEILIERGDITPEDLQAVLAAHKKLGELLVEKGIVDPAQIESAIAEQQHLREIRKERQTSESVTSVRVPSDKLDSLVNLVGELVTLQSHLSQLAASRNDPSLFLVSEEVERLTENLRDNTMNIRMLPIGTTFSKFKRLVRDLSNELGKEIELTTEGAETELDKTVIEKLGDPLVHLIRNSIDHGIEMPQDRVASGKSRKGTVHLAAEHSGAHVLIRITDDGKGLDSEAIRLKAIERGLVQENAVLADKDIFSLIFAPGFSTAKIVSNVSGRGVGMDVVKKAIESLRGEIDIQSRMGKGTTITLKLPLTLAIIDGFLVNIGGDHFVIPLSIVAECMELTPEVKERSHGRNIVNVRGHVVPYIRLREFFNINGRLPDIEHLVIVENNSARVGFLVDQIIGEHKTVLKNLGSFYKDVEGVSGATLLGDGSVALILDIPKLVSRFETEEETAGVS